MHRNNKCARRRHRVSLCHRCSNHCFQGAERKEGTRRRHERVERGEREEKQRERLAALPDSGTFPFLFWKATSSFPAHAPLLSSAMAFSVADYLLTDDLTILLALISATVFLLNNLYKPQPLVHPILLGRQSDVGRARNPGESAVYRNYGTGLAGRVRTLFV